MTKFRIVLINILMLSSLGWLGSCQEATENANQFSIVATTGMIADAARQIAGDSAQVRGLMGPGVDPHLYKPTQGDIRDLTNADLLLYNGLHLEGKMQEVLEKLARRKAVQAVAAGIPETELIILNQPRGAPDPHIWFDVSLWMEAVKTISQSMQEHDPAHAAYYQERTQAYLQELESLDKEVQQQLAAIPPQQRTLVTAHDAFSYFGRAYGIEVRGLQGISTLSEYGIQDIQNMVDFLVEEQIKAVFVESSVSPRALEAVVEGARQRGHAVRIGGSLYSDALGEAGIPEGNYTGMVRHNVETIRRALQ